MPGLEICACKLLTLFSILLLEYARGGVLMAVLAKKLGLEVAPGRTLQWSSQLIDNKKEKSRANFRERGYNNNAYIGSSQGAPFISNGGAYFWNAETLNGFSGKWQDYKLLSKNLAVSHSICLEYLLLINWSFVLFTLLVALLNGDENYSLEWVTSFLFERIC